MSAEESFTPTSRLYRDSARSPTCPRMPSTSAKSSPCPSGSATPSRASTSAFSTGTVARAPSTPAIEPDQVFPGLTLGQSLGPPIARPANMAAVSQTQVTTSGKNTSHAPAQEKPPYAPCRIGIRKAASPAG